MYTNNELELYFQQILEINKIPDSLVIVYSDIHGYHGGLAYELKANGVLARTQIQRRGEPETNTKSIDNSQLQDVFKLVCELKLWNQKEPARAANPDESRAYFHIEANGKEANSWEWYNDLEHNNCLIKLRNKFQELFAE